MQQLFPKYATLRMHFREAFPPSVPAHPAAPFKPPLVFLAAPVSFDPAQANVSGQMNSKFQSGHLLVLARGENTLARRKT